MAAATLRQLVFQVNRRDPELITPSKPTPHDLKPLSDIDNQDFLRRHTRNLFMYPYHPSMEEEDPVKLMRESLAKALVFYYPFAGRLKEGPNRKLIVECNGHGVMFVEAEADVALEQFGELRPPFPDSVEELLFDVPGSSGILNCPLLLIQVTRLRCGAIILGISTNHTICDGYGLFQFLVAVSEMARGYESPSVLPVWMRHILNARNPPCITCKHPEFEELAPVTYDDEELLGSKTTVCSFFLGPTEISTIRGHVPIHLRRCSNFDILTACFWRCRTIALQPNPNDNMRIVFTVNARKRLNSLIPKGYYGNCMVYAAAIATAGELCQNPVEYALELVMKAKNRVTEEHVQSTADLLVIRGMLPSLWDQSFLVSDMTRVLGNLDFGWGKPVYGHLPASAAVFMASRNKKGEGGILVPMRLPTLAMERFVKELDSLLKEKPIYKSIRSSL